jgi:hypothetical protein
MASFTMLFAGLILHHAKGVRAKTAVLVDALHHTPKLIIPKGVPVEEPTSWTGVDTDYGREYDLRRRKIKIEDIDQSGMGIDLSFLRHVPSLKNFFEADDDLVSKVGSKEIEDEVTAAFVDYSGGALSIFDFFEKEVRFIPPMSDDPHCLARTIQFDGTTTGPKIKIQDELDGYIVVPDQTQIRIENISEHPGGHQKEYRRLMKQKRDPRRMVETNRTCRSSSLKAKGDTFPEFLSLSIECSNSQWP